VYPAPLGLYVHIPFCSAICNYCNFNRGLFDADLKARYVDALVKEIKGASSHLVTHELEQSAGFKWQGAYAAFTVSRWDIARIRQYILNQEAHHKAGTIDPDYEW